MPSWSISVRSIHLLCRRLDFRTQHPFVDALAQTGPTRLGISSGVSWVCYSARLDASARAMENFGVAPRYWGFGRRCFLMHDGAGSLRTHYESVALCRWRWQLTQSAIKLSSSSWPSWLRLVRWCTCKFFGAPQSWHRQLSLLSACLQSIPYASASSFCHGRFCWNGGTPRGPSPLLGK